MDGKRQRSSPPPGLTFVELAVVTALIGAAVMIVYPYLSGLLLGRKLMGYAGEMAGVLDYIRSRAVIDGREYHVHFDRNRHRYWVTVEGDEEEPFPGRYGSPQELPAEVMLRSVEIEGRPAAGRRPTVRFFPRGSADQAVVYLESFRGDRASVRVKPFTGRSEVYNYFYRD